MALQQDPLYRAHKDIKEVQKRKHTLKLYL